MRQSKYSLGIEKQNRVGQQKELHIAGDAPAPIDAHVLQIKEILYKKQIAPPMLGAQLIEALMNVVNGGVANVSEYQVHAANDNDVKRAQSQIAMEEQLAKELGIGHKTILTHCLHLLDVAHKVIGLQEATANSRGLDQTRIPPCHVPT